jgi:hypothetical protein
MGRRESRRGQERARHRDVETRSGTDSLGRFAYCLVMSKSADKPKKQQKKKPQKTLKERRSEKRAAKKLGSGSLLRADE